MVSGDAKISLPRFSTDIKKLCEQGVDSYIMGVVDLVREFRWIPFLKEAMEDLMNREQWDCVPFLELIDILSVLVGPDMKLDERTLCFSLALRLLKWGGDGGFESAGNQIMEWGDDIDEYEIAGGGSEYPDSESIDSDDDSDGCENADSDDTVDADSAMRNSVLLLLKTIHGLIKSSDVGFRRWFVNEQLGEFLYHIERLDRGAYWERAMSFHFRLDVSEIERSFSMIEADEPEVRRKVVEKINEALTSLWEDCSEQPGRVCEEAMKAFKEVVEHLHDACDFPLPLGPIRVLVADSCVGESDCVLLWWRVQIMALLMPTGSDLEGADHVWCACEGLLFAHFPCVIGDVSKFVEEEAHASKELFNDKDLEIWRWGDIMRLLLKMVGGLARIREFAERLADWPELEWFVSQISPLAFTGNVVFKDACASVLLMIGQIIPELTTEEICEGIDEVYDAGESIFLLPGVTEDTDK
jgi:hypothetical protein